MVQVIILLIMAGDQETWTADLLAGLASLLTLDKSRSLESAGVPSGLEKAENWLRTELSDSFTEFNQKFGRRCL